MIQNDESTIWYKIKWWSQLRRRKKLKYQSQSVGRAYFAMFVVIGYMLLWQFVVAYYWKASDINDMDKRTITTKQYKQKYIYTSTGTL